MGGGGRPEYRASMIRAARCLLSSVTRVLLLADTVVVKQLLLAKDKVGGCVVGVFLCVCVFGEGVCVCVFGRGDVCVCVWEG